MVGLEELQLACSAEWHRSYLREPRILVDYLMIPILLLVPRCLFTIIIITVVSVILFLARRKIAAPLSQAARLTTCTFTFGIVLLRL